MKKLLLKNRKASFDFEILEKFEAGASLFGHEVKSIKNGGGNFVGSFVSLQNNELFLKGFNVKLYEKSTLPNYEPERPRKLLLRKAEITKIAGALNTKGVTLIPLSCIASNGKIKFEIAIARGKKKYDKREDKKKKDAERRIKAAISNY